MIQRDYIQRLIQEMSRFISRLINKNIEEKEEIIREYYQWMKIDTVCFDMDDEAFLLYLNQEKKVNIHEIEFLASITYEEGAILAQKDDRLSAINKLNKSLILHEYFETNSEVYSLDIIAKKSEIKALILSLENK